MDSSTSTLQRQRARSTGKLSAAQNASVQGLGLNTPYLNATPAAGRGRGRLRLLRQATLAKFVPAALPLFDVSVAVLQSLDEMRAAVGEDMALASTLHVPAHHLLQCQAEAYGTPFKAPALQTLDGASSLTEDDKQFAACLAQPPEMEEEHMGGSMTIQHRLIRMASLVRMQQAPSLEAQPTFRHASISDSKFQMLDRSDSTRRRAPPPARQRSLADDDTDGADALRTAASDAQHATQHAQHEADGEDVLRTALDAQHAQREAERQEQLTMRQRAPAGADQQQQVPLLASCKNPVGALVGLGALMVQGFAESRVAPADELMERRVRALLGVKGLVVCDKEGRCDVQFSPSTRQPSFGVSDA